MKFAFLFLLFVSGFNSSAFAQDCSISLSVGGGPWSAMNAIRGDQQAITEIKTILADKGYVVSEDKKATTTYSLWVAAGAGYSCGTGLTWLQRHIIPVQWSMLFKGPNVTIDQYKSGAGLAFEASVARSVRKAIHLVKQLPVCGEQQ